MNGAKIFGDAPQPVDADPWTIIEALRAEEGSCVTIFADNADFGGPGAAIEVAGDWTDWVTRRFTGDTVLLALQAALEAMNGPRAEPVEETV